MEELYTYYKLARKALGMTAVEAKAWALWEPFEAVEEVEEVEE